MNPTPVKQAPKGPNKDIGINPGPRVKPTIPAPPKKSNK